MTFNNYIIKDNGVKWVKLIGINSSPGKEAYAEQVPPDRHPDEKSVLVFWGITIFLNNSLQAKRQFHEDTRATGCCTK